MTLAVAQIVRFVSDPQSDIKDAAISSELIASLNAKTCFRGFQGADHCLPQLQYLTNY